MAPCFFAGSVAARILCLANLAGIYRADLDFTTFSEIGDSANRFSTDLAAFTNLSAGSQSNVFHAMFAIDQLGMFSATYFLEVADAAGILGGTGDMLTLNVFGTVVVPEPATYVLGIIGSAAFAGGEGFRVSPASSTRHITSVDYKSGRARL